MSIVAKQSPISATAELLLTIMHRNSCCMMMILVLMPKNSMAKNDKIAYCLLTFFFTPVTGVMFILRTGKTLSAVFAASRKSALRNWTDCWIY